MPLMKNVAVARLRRSVVAIRAQRSAFQPSSNVSATHLRSREPCVSTEAACSDGVTANTMYVARPRAAVIIRDGARVAPGGMGIGRAQHGTGRSSIDAVVPCQA